MLPRGGAGVRGRGGPAQSGVAHAQGQGISVQGAAGQGQRGGIARGGGMTRGRGVGRGGIDPGAPQFTPGALGTQGNKRPHEGGDEGAGKRMRGGAGGV
jgi:nucleoprotein TPR